MAQQFTATGILWRVLFSLALVFLTFNPSGHSYYHWAKESVPHLQPAIAVCGIVLLGAWLFFVRSTLSSMGAVGFMLGIGMSWAHIRQRISGQASVDRVDHGH